jgi:methionyl-tRNA synthetase
MLKVAGYSLPTQVHVHGFLTVNGEKMSKSKGTFVMASTYLRHLDPAYLRYFYASKLTPKVDDIDLNLEEFATKVNADLVGKVVNLASRTARFVDRLSERYPDDEGLFEAGAKLGEDIAAAYDACDFARAMRLVMSLADRANEYIDKKEPWKLKKDPAAADTMRDVCTVALNLYRQLAVYLAPVLPKLSQQSGELLNDDLSAWKAASVPLAGTPVGKFQHLLARVDMQAVNKMVAETLSAEPRAAPTPAGVGSESAVTDSDEPLKAEPIAAECSIDDFSKVDLRVARIIAAAEVPQADKLLKLTLSLGGDERRTVFAGIKAAYRPETLVGRLVVVAANLAPRRMKFGTSEGMVIAAGPGKQEVFLLAPDAGAKPGQRVH